MIKKDIVNLVKKVLIDDGISTEKLIVENSEYGDYSCAVALKIGKFQNYQSPKEVANYIVAKLPKNNIIKKVEVADPGFINFTIEPKIAVGFIDRIIDQGDDFGKSQLGKGSKIQVEFISANPTGPLTLGNGRGAFIGDTLSRVLELSGFDIEREYYLNDRGNQADLLGKSVLNQVLLNRKEKTIENTQLYQGDYIKELAKKYDKAKDPNKILSKITQESLAEIIIETKKLVQDKLKVSFDVWFSEADLYQKKLQNKVLKKLHEKKLTFEKDSSIWFKSTAFGDDKDRVLVKSNGDYTYFLSDIIHKAYLSAAKFDKLVLLLGADHHGYQGRLQAAMSAFGYQDKLDVIIYQFVRLLDKGKEVSMSKRTGNYIALEELIDEVGLDVTRFFFNMYSPHTHIDFDLNLAKEKSNKNPVFYVQYAHARLCSILANAPSLKKETNLSLLVESEELTLIKKLIQFDDLIEEISINYAVHQLPYYALKVAELFHNFYEKHKVISENKDLMYSRIKLIYAAKITLANTLQLLGVSAPEKM